MTDLNRSTAAVLHYMTLVGIAILVIGLLLHPCDISDRILLVGALILVFTPMAGVIVSTACLAKLRDAYWLKTAVVLVLVIAVGLVLTYLK